MKYLIVNADDFGLSPGINRGIARAHDHGIVTSASLMVRPAAAQDAAELSRHRPNLDLGLHLDFGEWSYRDGNWVELYHTAPADDPAAIAHEIERQLNAFRQLIGRDPTHLDSHQHAHRQDPIRSAVLHRAAQLAIPVRHFHPQIQFCGNFYGQGRHTEPCPEAITVGALQQILSGLTDGTTELACHPAESHDFTSDYSHERIRELESLCDPRIQATLREQNVTLSSFKQSAL